MRKALILLALLAIVATAQVTESAYAENCIRQTCPPTMAQTKRANCVEMCNATAKLVANNPKIEELSARLEKVADELAAMPRMYSNVAAFGVSYKPGDATPIAGTGLYAKATGENLWAFTAIDALPATYTPFTVTTNISAGVAPRVAQLGKVSIYVPTAAGISWSGTNTGWNWNMGGLAKVPFYKNLSLLPNLRFVKSSVNNNSGYQLIGGLLFSFGW